MADMIYGILLVLAAISIPLVFYWKAESIYKILKRFDSSS